MFYTIYKTTNTINGKFYIGKHKTEDINDDYLGSGKRLKYAIKKYGINNFHKEILHVCESEKQMDILEKILVVPDKETNYNMCPGGHGGFGYINSFIYTKERRQKHNAKTSPIASKIGQKSLRKRREENPEWAEQCDKKTSISMKSYFDAGGMNGFEGKSHTQEHKDKMSRIMKEKQKGQLNSQYGTCWITNGIENKKIKKEKLASWIELGYNKGRNKVP